MSNSKPGISVRFERTPKGFKASLRFHLRHHVTDHHPADITVMGFADGASSEDSNATAAHALRSALAVADMTLSNPAMQLLLPPGTMQTIAITKALADAAPKGALAIEHAGKSLWSHFTGGMKKLAKGLSSVDGCGALMGGEPIALVGMKRPPHNFTTRASALAHMSTQAFNRAGTMVTNPYASVNPSANPYATNPWAPFPVPNQAQSPAPMATPDLAPPADATNYDGTPSEAYQEAATNEEIDAATQMTDPTATAASADELALMGAEDFAAHFHDPNAEW